MLATYIVSHGKFPSGLSTMEWADIDGRPHTFTSPQQFMAFATAVIDILVALKAGNVPAQSASIP